MYITTVVSDINKKVNRCSRRDATARGTRGRSTVADLIDGLGPDAYKTMQHDGLETKIFDKRGEGCPPDQVGGAAELPGKVWTRAEGASLKRIPVRGRSG